VRHIAFSLAGSGIDYAPGDALGVVPENPPDMVAAILAATGLEAATPVTLGREMMLYDALTREFSLGRLTQAMLIKFARRAGDPELDNLLKPENAEALKTFLDGRDLIDLLLRYPGVIRTADDIVALVPRLAPRLYSISSSPKAHPGEVHLTVAAVRYNSHGRDRVGIASTFLADRAGKGAVDIYIQRNIRFRLPNDDDAPVIMVGPGTGIAPFRAFLEERRATGARGRNWLFFGDRRQAHDFLYRDELERFRSEGVLSRLDTAFSRDQAAKVYVQHRMLESGAGIWHWLQDGAHFYVCGDASRMAKDVDRALKEIIARHGRMGPAAAQLEVDQMIATGRYVRDVY
jgi:sulfite reductase (NADPH) flavoprotein alpha-component